MEDMAMRTNFDLSPLFRSSIGFDRVFDLLESASRLQPVDTWPPYDIARQGDDAYRITMALAGYTPEDVTVTYKPNLLIVSGSRSEKDDSNYLHRGLNGGSFERNFELADFVEVADARLENGLLTIDLKRELPEAMKPRRIAIGTSQGHPGEAKQIEGQKQAA
jgi:molecular chaperone IbpA